MRRKSLIPRDSTRCIKMRRVPLHLSQVLISRMTRRLTLVGIQKLILHVVVSFFWSWAWWFTSISHAIIAFKEKIPVITEKYHRDWHHSLFARAGLEFFVSMPFAFSPCTRYKTRVQLLPPSRWEKKIVPARRRKKTWSMSRMRLQISYDRFDYRHASWPLRFGNLFTCQLY